MQVSQRHAQEHRFDASERPVFLADGATLGHEPGDDAGLGYIARGLGGNQPGDNGLLFRPYPFGGRGRFLLTIGVTKDTVPLFLDIGKRHVATFG